MKGAPGPVPRTLDIASGIDGRRAVDGRRQPVSIERKNEHDH